MAEVRSKHTVHTLLRLSYHWLIGSIILRIVLIVQQSNFPRVVGLPGILPATQTGVCDSHLSVRTSCTVLFGYNQWKRGSNIAPQVLDASHPVLSTFDWKRRQCLHPHYLHSLSLLILNWEGKENKCPLLVFSVLSV